MTCSRFGSRYPPFTCAPISYGYGEEKFKNDDFYIDGGVCFQPRGKQY